jgi:hypothetical protein
MVETTFCEYDRLTVATRLAGAWTGKADDYQGMRVEDNEETPVRLRVVVAQRVCSAKCTRRGWKVVIASDRVSYQPPKAKTRKETILINRHVLSVAPD